MKHPKGESHRIYWQQWLTPSPSSAGGPKSRRELITSSAAIRISPDTARARDVTKLLRDTLNLSSLNNGNGNNDNSVVDDTSADRFRDSLVLVGTLYSLPPDYVQFEHEPPPIVNRTPSPQPSNPQRTPPGSSWPNGHNALAKNDSSKQLPVYYYSSSQTSEPFHVVKTLAPNDNPLKVRDVMMDHLRRIQASTNVTLMITGTANKVNSSSSASSTTSSMSLISPKIQWYFVPGTSEPSSPIPSCIDLDGYCTSMENDDDEEESENGSHGMFDEDENDDCDSASNDERIWDDSSPNFDLLLSRCPLSTHFPSSRRSSTGDSKAVGNFTPPSSLDDSVASKKAALQLTCKLSAAELERRRQRRELRRYTQLSQCRSLSNQCVSGYLLKRSHCDPHVWRRVHCVLTEDSFWHVTRVSTYRHQKVHAQSTDVDVSNSNSPQQRYQPRFRMARRHGRIDLVRALLLEPNTTDYSPLYRTPYSFEVVSAKGTSHVFRAGNRTVQLQWIQALSERIAQRRENDLMAHAELIVADECIARNKRLACVAVQPLWTAFQKQVSLTQQHQNPQQPATPAHPDSMVGAGAGALGVGAIPPSPSSSSLASRGSASISAEGSSTTKSTPGVDDGDSSATSGELNLMMHVLRFGMEVAEYRERCRHVQSILPAKQPIVVLSDSPLTRNTSSSSMDNHHPESQTHNHNKVVEPEPLDEETKAMVRGTWGSAASLLARATQVAMDVQHSVSTNGPSPTSAIVSPKEGKRLSRSLETLCRHIDYVITGQHRPLSDHGRKGFFVSQNDPKGNHMNRRSPLPIPPTPPTVASKKTNGTGAVVGGEASHYDIDPPPVDLFDLLLAELQLVAATSDFRRSRLDQDIR